MSGPIVALAARLARDKADLRREVRRLNGELAAVHEVADVWQQRALEAEAALRDLELIHGWLEAT